MSFFFLMLMCGIKCEYGIFWVLIFLGKGYNLILAVEVALVTENLLVVLLWLHEVFFEIQLENHYTHSLMADH